MACKKKKKQGTIGVSCSEPHIFGMDLGCPAWVRRSKLQQTDLYDLTYIRLLVGPTLADDNSFEAPDLVAQTSHSKHHLHRHHPSPENSNPNPITYGH